MNLTIGRMTTEDTDSLVAMSANNVAFITADFKKNNGVMKISLEKAVYKALRKHQGVEVINALIKDKLDNPYMHFLNTHLTKEVADCIMSKYIVLNNIFSHEVHANQRFLNIEFTIDLQEDYIQALTFALQTILSALTLIKNSLTAEGTFEGINTFDDLVNIRKYCSELPEIADFINKIMTKKKGEAESTKTEVKPQEEVKEEPQLIKDFKILSSDTLFKDHTQTASNAVQENKELEK